MLFFPLLSIYSQFREPDIPSQLTIQPMYLQLVERKDVNYYSVIEDSRPVSILGSISD